MSRHTEKTKLNVGGMTFKCYTKTLKKFPNSLLANLDKHNEHCDQKEREYFFDRDPHIFTSILNAYRTGTVHLPRDICGANFREELEFWGLTEQIVGECCWEALFSSEDTIETIQTVKGICNLNTCTGSPENQIRIKKKIWQFLHEPKSSGYAKVWSIFMSFVITTSVLVSALETVSTTRTETYTDAERETIEKMVNLLTGKERTDYLISLYRKPSAIATSLDAFCFAVLTLELVIVFCLCPSKSDFLKCLYHLSEIVCSCAFWFGFICRFNLEHISSSYLLKAMLVCKYVTLLKLVRLIRIARHFPALRIMSLTVCVSRYELNMLVFMLFVLISLFGSLLFVAESAQNNTFGNLFAAMYWALITLTTVGYGDYAPSTPIGRVVACICSVCGVMILALPIGIFASNFDNLYRHHQYVTKYYEIQKNKTVSREEVSASLATSVKPSSASQATSVKPSSASLATSVKSSSKLAHANTSKQNAHVIIN